VKIAVYYESLCPDSKRFITAQLAPVWRDFRGNVKVKMVPYGKSTGDELLAAYGEKTDLVQRPLGFVPTVVINE
ncbi:Lysosomal thiol reductase IP30 isoform 1, partial [Operophtera brumata]